MTVKHTYTFCIYNKIIQYTHIFVLFFVLIGGPGLRDRAHWSRVTIHCMTALLRLPVVPQRTASGPGMRIVYFHVCA